MGQRLLLVDSDRSFLKEHQVSLEAAFDLEVTGTTDGVIQRLESGAFAAVFICVEVADHKGYALCSTIRKNAQLDGVKIALISAKATEEEYRRHQSLKGKADLYLHKPIAPSALVAALLPLVPGRVLDPDNPLGDLVDTELGDDWLDSLKSSLDEIPAAMAPIAPPAAQAPPAPPALPQTPQDSGRVVELEALVRTLQDQLHAKDQKILATETDLRDAQAEAQQTQRQLSSVTMNLDELEQSQKSAETLKTRLAETEAALHQLEERQGRDEESSEALRAQLREALTERAELIQQVETLNHQVGEKAQRAVELLRERDRLLNDNMDLESHRIRAQELEQVLTSKDEAHAALGKELEASKVAHEQLNATIEGLVEQHARLDGLHQSAVLEVAGYRERAHSLQMEMAGLEATLRGQGRDLAEVGDQLRQREAELAASQAAHAASEASLAEREQELLAKEEILQQHVGEVARLTTELANLHQDFSAATIQHEGERLELMNGLDQKDAELARLNQALAEQAQAHGELEREKQAIHGQLAEHRDRLQNLDGLLKDIQDQLRRGSDLVRG